MNSGNWDAAGYRDALERCMAARGATRADITAATGVRARVFERLDAGVRPDAASLAALSAWSGLPPAQFNAAEPLKPKPRFQPDALASAISGMVKAAVDQESGQYAEHEATLREQLRALQRQINQAARDI